METIDEFRGDYRFLSNFARAPMTIAGIKCPTSEHAYQAMKTRSGLGRLVIAQAETPGEAKRLGGPNGIVDLRDDWDDVKVDVMTQVVLAKFIQNDDLAQKLLATGNARLVEGNHWNDTFWGVCRGKGQNHLGVILMNTRSLIAPLY